MGSVVEDLRRNGEWIAGALRSSGYRADFGPASLAEIDRFLDEHAPDGQPRPDGLLADGLGTKVFALGGYVGETIRRHIGGEWQADDADSAAEVNALLRLPDGSVIWPVQRVIKRLRNGPEDGLAGYGAALGAATPPGPARRLRPPVPPA